jgi:hypothetical protein
MIRTLLATCVLMASTISAQSFSYPDFSSTSQLNLLGNSLQTGNSIRLTANASNQTGWIWHQNALPLVNGFDTTFTFRILPPPFGTKAEGMALVIHDDPAGAAATGGTVWGMGYGSGANNSAGIRKSIAIELDTYLDPFLSDSSANELTIHTRGATGNNENEAWSIGRTTPPGNFVDGQVHTVRVVYVPGTIDVYYDNAATPTLSRSYDLVNGGQLASGASVGGIGSLAGTGFAGFCATTGAGSLTEQVEILSWDWTSTPFTDPCYEGTLGADILTIDGSAGGFFRRVELATYQPFGIELDNPPSFGAGAPYVLFASLLPQPGAIGTGLGFGNACFPMLPAGATELVLADTFGLGPSLLPASPTPHTISIPSSVIAFPLDLTLQAVTLDTSSPLTLGLSNAIELSIQAVGPPQITSVNPLSGVPNVLVTIAGQGFVPGLQLSIAGVPTPIISLTPTQVVFQYSAGTPCGANLTLSNPDGQLVSSVLNPNPVVTGTVLGSGSVAGGAVFLVQGSGFAVGTTVTIGGAPASVLSASASIVSMYTPPGSLGVAQVVLTTPGGCVATTTYTYQ